MVSRIPSDIYAALLLVALGAATLIGTATYPVGTLTQMGPGFYPRAIGCIMIGLGLLVALGARGSAGVALRPSRADVRGWLCIVGGIAAFTVLGPHGGLVPATFAIVFISALGNQRNTVKDALLLALAMVVLSVVVFGLALKIQMPLIGWS